MNDSIRKWIPISEDLTRGDSILGGRYPAMTALAQSPLDSLRLYAGTQDGHIWTTGDGGENWINITEGTPGFYVTSITASTIDAEAVYATYSGYRDNDHQPYIYYSEDAGQSWEPVHTDLPVLGVNDLFIVPGTTDNTIVVGTDGGVYLSVDGSGWQRVGNNMPYMPVYDIDYNPVEARIIAATFSRGIMTFPAEELEVETTSGQDVAGYDYGVRVYPTLFKEQIHVDLAQIEPANRSKLMCPLLYRLVLISSACMEAD
jgi:hypothetical protein